MRLPLSQSTTTTTVAVSHKLLQRYQRKIWWCAGENVPSGASWIISAKKMSFFREEEKKKNGETVQRHKLEHYFWHVTRVPRLLQLGYHLFNHTGRHYGESECWTNAVEKKNPNLKLNSLLAPGVNRTQQKKKKKRKTSQEESVAQKYGAHIIKLVIWEKRTRLSVSLWATPFTAYPDRVARRTRNRAVVLFSALKVHKYASHVLARKKPTLFFSSQSKRWAGNLHVSNINSHVEV